MWLFWSRCARLRGERPSVTELADWECASAGAEGKPVRRSRGACSPCAFKDLAPRIFFFLRVFLLREQKTHACLND